MTTQFDRLLYGYRFVDTNVGDTLQIIAARELGDANRWTDLIAYNGLVPPFITDDPAQVKAGVILTGRQILVPAPEPVVSGTINPELVFESDIKLAATGEVLTENGDFAVVSGRANLVQAIEHRVETERGELIYHPGYGCDVRRVVGMVNGPTASLLAAQYTKVSVQADPRVNRVTKATAEVVGDVIKATVEVETVAGGAVLVSANP